jgi:hypothetical protein
MDPIMAITMALDVHPSPGNINESLDSRPNIIDNYDWPNATTVNHEMVEPNRARLATTTAMVEEGQNTTKRVFDPGHPGPSIDEATQNHFHESPFGVLLNNEVYSTFCQGIRQQEFLRLMGEPNNIQADNDWTNNKLYDRMKQRVPATTLQWAAQTIFLTKLATVGPVTDPFSPSREPTNIQVLLNRVNINEWMTIPLPTKPNWQQATIQDHDLKGIVTAMQSNTNIKKNGLNETAWFMEWKGNRLKEEDGLIYHYEAPKQSRLRQLRTRAVPTSFILTILMACHTSPMSGHTNRTKMYYCKTQEPFDVIFLDVWMPGDFPAQWGAIKALICIEGMGSFAEAALIENANSKTVAQAAFASFFMPNGLPKLVIVNAGSKLAGALTEMCTSLGVPFHRVANENHKAILNEQFRPYLNKVQKIHQANCESLDQWVMGLFFALYGWNASPVDGTNIMRSLAAKKSTFG